MSQKMNLDGQIFGRLEVLGPASNKNGRTQWLVKCRCGTIKSVYTHQLISKKTQSCGCLVSELVIHRNKMGLLPSGSNSKFWKGCGEIRAGYWNDVKKGARRRGISLEVTIEEAWQKFLSQNRRCALSGWDIGFSTRSRHPHTTKQTASLDRIDSRQGYNILNIQWVHKDINTLKGKFDDYYLIEMCKAIASHKS